jgi:hypothetical protein
MVHGYAWGLGAAAAMALAIFAFTADAQQKAPEKAEPVAKAKVKAKSVCNAITEEAACKANTTCAWVAALMDAKTGKQKRKAYCRTQGTSAKTSTTPAK